MKKIHDFDQVFDSQKMYRILLEAFSNPGRKLSIAPFAQKMYGSKPEFLALAMTLLDNEVGFAACKDEELAQQIVSLTLSREEALECADYLFLSDAASLEEAVEKAKCGTLKDPQKSGTLLILTGNGAEQEITLAGPGIKDRMTVRVPERVLQALTLRDSQFYEYPQGIDLVFITEDKELFALPRLVKTVKEEET